jgi:hypothetical protein
VIGAATWSGYDICTKKELWDKPAAAQTEDSVQMVLLRGGDGFGRRKEF